MLMTARNFVRVTLTSLQGKLEDIDKFIHDQSSISGINHAPGFSKLGLFADRQGRVLSTALMLRTARAWELIVPEDLAEALKKFQAPWLMLGRMQLTIHPEAVNISIGKNNSEKIDIQSSDNYDAITYHNEGNSIKFSWSTNQESEPSEVCQYAQLMQAMPVWIRQTAIASLTPSDLGYTDAGLVDFDKGCYLGQEIIARMFYRKSKKKEVVIEEFLYDSKSLTTDENERVQLSQGHWIRAENPMVETANGSFVVVDWDISPQAITLALLKPIKKLPKA